MKNKKSIKAWAAGILSAAIAATAVLGAMPAVSVQAAETVYTESDGHAGTVVKAYDNGSVDHTFTEGVMNADGELAFCIQLGVLFEPGYKTMVDASSEMPQEQITNIALCLEYISNYADSHDLSYSQEYLLKQCMVWRRLSAYQNWGYGQTHPSTSDVPQNIQDEVFSNALTFASENKDLYNCYGYIYKGAGQNLAQFYAELLAGHGKILKKSASPAITDGNSLYTLKKATYTVYSDEGCTQKVGKLQTKTTGKSKALNVAAGTYYVKETAAPKGYVKDTKVYKLVIEEGKTTTLEVEDTPKAVVPELVIQKIDKELQEGTPQGGASLKGARFEWNYYNGYYTADDLPEKPTRTWVTETRAERDDAGNVYYPTRLDADYKVSGDDLYTLNKKTVLPLGTITVREIGAPTGYLLEGAYLQEAGKAEKISGLYVAQIKDGDEKVTITGANAFRESDQVIRGGVKIQKRDLETGEAKPQGAASLDETIFTVTTLNENPVLVDGTRYTKDQVVLTLHTKDGFAETANDALPYGRYRIDETQPPKGYLSEGSRSIEFEIINDKEVIDLTSQEKSMKNQVIRGDLELVKVGNGEQERLANVPFTITSVTTGESHTIVTDVNGYASTAASWNKHTQNTNRGKTSEDGIWFGTSEPNDKKGALIYDKYIIEEQRCASNEGRNLLKFETVVYKDSVTIDLGTLTDDLIDIGTTATDKNTGTHMSDADGKVTIVDEVEYSGLKKGQKYRLVGTLIDPQTAEPLLIDEKKITSEKEFTAQLPEGRLQVAFTFDAAELAGRTTVIFEELYQNDTLLVAHDDPNNTDQTVYFPKIGTTAKDSETGGNIANADKEVTLVDTVIYENLTVGEEYEIIGTLIDKETGKAIEADGKPVTASTTFTPEEPSGSVEVTFTFDGSVLAGKTVVAEESLEYEEREVAVHADINDEDQTVYFPEIHTTATDAASGSHSAKPAESVTIKDTVTYANLIPGKEYHLSGTLMDKETGEALLSGETPVTAEADFIPDAAEGTAELLFTFDASALEGKAVVAFESLSYEEKEVASHADLADEGQTVYFPEIHTTAADAKTGEHLARPDDKVELTDTVVYHNLAPGVEYEVTGTLMNKKTGKALELDGKPITATAAFTPDAPDGSVVLTFTFDAAVLSEKAVVAFESVTYEGIEVAVHADINDEDQTVYFPSIGTKAADKKDGDQKVEAGKDAEIVDTVAYQGLVPGLEYRISGTLIDKETGEPVKADGKDVTAEAVFIPDEPDGETEVTFTFDATKLAGHKLVVFEQLFIDRDETDEPIAVHEDIDDKDQTITIPESPKETPAPSATPTPSESTRISAPVQTGDDAPLGRYAKIAAASLLLVLIIVCYLRKRKKKQ